METIHTPKWMERPPPEWTDEYTKIVKEADSHAKDESEWIIYHSYKEYMKKLRSESI